MHCNDRSSNSKGHTDLRTHGHARKTTKHVTGLRVCHHLIQCPLVPLVLTSHLPNEAKTAAARTGPTSPTVFYNVEQLGSNHVE